MTEEKIQQADVHQAAPGSLRALRAASKGTPCPKADALTSGIREDGTVEGWIVETHYRACDGIMTDAQLGCVRVIADDGPTNIETRVLFSTLIADGWVPPSAPTGQSRTSEAGEATCASNEPDEQDTASLPLPQPTGERE